MEKRIFNFSAGPAVLPEEALKEAREYLMALPGVGMSVLEISHRSKTFDDIINQTRNDIKKLLNISDDTAKLFLHGSQTAVFPQTPGITYHNY